MLDYKLTLLLIKATLEMKDLYNKGIKDREIIFIIRTWRKVI